MNSDGNNTTYIWMMKLSNINAPAYPAVSVSSQTERDAYEETNHIRFLWSYHFWFEMNNSVNQLLC